MLHALTTGALAFWGHAHTELVAQWLAGSLYGAEWQHLRTLLPWTLIGLVGVGLLVRPLEVMQLDDQHVRTLGLGLNRWRAFALLIATLLAASAVGVVVGRVCSDADHASLETEANNDLAHCCTYAAYPGSTSRRLGRRIR